MTTARASHGASSGGDEHHAAPDAASSIYLPASLDVPPIATPPACSHRLACFPAAARLSNFVVLTAYQLCLSTPPASCRRPACLLARSPECFLTPTLSLRLRTRPLAPTLPLLIPTSPTRLIAMVHQQAHATVAEPLAAADRTSSSSSSITSSHGASHADSDSAAQPAASASSVASGRPSTSPPPFTSVSSYAR